MYICIIYIYIYYTCYICARKSQHTSDTPSRSTIQRPSISSIASILAYGTAVILGSLLCVAWAHGLMGYPKHDYHLVSFGDNMGIYIYILSYFLVWQGLHRWLCDVSFFFCCCALRPQIGNYMIYIKDANTDYRTHLFHKKPKKQRSILHIYIQLATGLQPNIK